MIHDHDPRRQVIRTIKFSHLMQLQRPVALRFINLSRNTQKNVGILPYSPLHLIAEDGWAINRASIHSRDFAPANTSSENFKLYRRAFTQSSSDFFFLHERAAIDVTTGVVFQSSSAGCSCSPSVFIRARKRVCCIVTWCWLRARLRWLFWFLMKFIVSPLSSTSDCKVTPIWFAVSAH